MEKHTIPATEEALHLDIDDHPMANERPRELSPFHPVVIDGILGTAAVGTLGGYSTRLAITLQTSHPELGTEFGTKYFRFLEPGVVMWGHEGKQFTIQKIVE